METEETQVTSTEETTEETTTEETTETSETTERKEGESQEDYRARLNAQNRFLEKEGYKFEGGKWVKQQAPSQEPAISPKDYLALTENKVSSEDFDEAQRVAKVLGKPLHEALKDPIWKTIQTEREETRRTAQATSTKSGRGATKPSDDDILRRASAGESLSEDKIADLARARHARNFKK